MEKKSKINTVDKVIMMILAVSADAAEALASLAQPIPVLGQTLLVIVAFYGFIISAIIIFWLIMKGASFKWFLGGSGLELIPFINILPFRIAALLATFAEDKLPLPKIAKNVLAKTQLK